MRLHIRRVVSGAALMLCGLWLLLTLNPGPSSLDSGPNPLDRKIREEEMKFMDDSKYQHISVKVNKALLPREQHNPKLPAFKIVEHKMAASLGDKVTDIEFPQYVHGQQKPLHLWPDPKKPYEDRILDQMRYVPRSSVHKDPDLESNIKTIYLPGGIGPDTPKGRKKFQDEHCPVDMCWLTDSSKWRHTADVVLYQNEYYYDQQEKPEHQIWVLWLLESPFHTGSLQSLNGALNWTATYRSDSTIVTPYEKFVQFSNVTSLPRKATKNYAEGKKKLVAWFVSNCSARNKRWEYVQALHLYGVDVHIYGACGDYQCDRFIDGYCDNMLKETYKFYLSFENSNCQGYITEKFFHNALKNDVVPIAMGGKREDYEAVAPPHSYIAVEDFSSPKYLAELLLKLDADDDKYNEYFRWKHTGEFINTKFWCRLCALVHDDSGMQQWYPDVEGWWRSNDTCTYDQWDIEEHFVNDWEKALGGE